MLLSLCATAIYFLGNVNFAEGLLLSHTGGSDLAFDVDACSPAIDVSGEGVKLYGEDITSLHVSKRAYRNHSTKPATCPR